MDDKQLTILINGRKALPVRAIPYVSGWDRFPPRLVAEYLYLGNDKFGGVMGNAKLGTKSPSLLTAYQLAGNTPVLVQPREWKGILTAFDGFEAKLKRKYGDSEKDEMEAEANWQRKAVKMLPEGVFVWLNEFETAFKVSRGRPGSFGRKRGDDELNLTPMMHDADTRAMVMAGFETLPTATGESSDAAGKVKAGAIVAPTKTKMLAQTWWRTEYEIMTMAQSAGDSLRRKGKRTSNRAIGDAVALEIEQREKPGKKRKGPDGQTIKNADLLGWKYEAE